MHEHIMAEKSSVLKAVWEQKTDKAIQNRILKERVEAMKRRKAVDLYQRKNKLAALLAQEDAQYENEFHQLIETPE